MVFYYLLGVFTVAVSFLNLAYNKENRTPRENYTFMNFHDEKATFRIVFISALLGVVAAIRNYVGTDYHIYLYFYDAVDLSSLANSIESNPQELFFSLIQFFFKQLFDRPYVFFFLCSFVTVFLSLMAMQNFGIKIGYGFFLFYFLCFYTMSLNTVRQSLALAICFFALSMRSKIGRLHYILFFIAGSIHASAILASAIYILFYDRKITKRLFIGTCLAGFFLFNLLQNAFALSILSRLNPRYESFAETQTAGFGTILHILFKVFLLLVLWKMNTDKNNKVFFYFLFLGVLMFLLSFYAESFGRMEPYFSVFYLILIPKIFDTRKNRFGSRSLISLAIFVYFGFSIFNFGGVVPYRTIFSS